MVSRRQSSFPPGTFAPYQVRLDNGKLIYAPIDEDRVCRQYTGEASAEAEDFEELDEEIPDEKKLAVTVRRPPACLPPTRPDHTAAPWGAEGHEGREEPLLAGACDGRKWPRR